MITDKLINLVTSKTRPHRRKVQHRALFWFLFGAAVVLVVAGWHMGHEKAHEFGLLWLFEQCVGGAKRSFFGSSE
jgi:hypothetical protein